MTDDKATKTYRDCSMYDESPLAVCSGAPVGSDKHKAICVECPICAEWLRNCFDRLREEALNEDH